MESLRVTATLASDLANPSRPPALDALLAYAQAVHVEGRPPPPPGAPMPPVEIPVRRPPCGRYHLCSFAQAAVEAFARGRFTNRRFPLAEAQYLAGPKLTRIGLTGGPCKSFRTPLETGWLEGDRVDWYAVGDAAAIRSLLAWVRYLGKRRGVGLGKVARWDVAPYDPAADGWTAGFPVIRDGRPLRNLPLDAMPPELALAFEGYGNVTYPYYERDREEPCIIAAS